MRKILGFLLTTVCLFTTPSAFAEDMTFRCHGRVYQTGFFFKYQIELHDRGLSQVRLTTSQGYDNSMDYGWKSIEVTSGKFPVDSPWDEYKAYLSRDGRNYNLVLVNPVTGVSIDNPPYDRFVCVVPL
ncbi:hypothetical protein [Bdellovibrio svalbardensis]|uniref:Secreted protein n=1 Tax=Bdellovibrio svalbardensis TaxID=2972972 RepID=A0ABT6DKX0_9BACT|nr:hypothetical protein [Bdellovibrio svalbardensis]MDG0817296.1 hypothetical protein [Bdellovibrio svalbardensis]